MHTCSVCGKEFSHGYSVKHGEAYLCLDCFYSMFGNIDLLLLEYNLSRYDLPKDKRKLNFQDMKKYLELNYDKVGCDYERIDQ